MIHYASPYDSSHNLGRAYNATLAMLPNDDDYACLTDADTMFTVPHYGAQIGRIAAEHPECGLFLALTNRIGCPWQRDPRVKGDDIRLHRAYGQMLARKRYNFVRDVSRETMPASGFLMLVKKATWAEAGGFREDGVLGVDNDFFFRVQALGRPILLMTGVYLYHWYRGGVRGDKSHLAPIRKVVPSTPDEIVDRTTLLNFLIKQRGYRRYLEIGVQNGDNLRHIACDHVVGVDPHPGSMAAVKLTSDAYFKACKDRFDLVFIDGLHHRDQVERDILNALAVVDPGGAIVLHDCNPATEAMQAVPRRQSCWTGEVWKAFVKFRQEWDYPSCVVDVDYGCGIIEYDARRRKRSTSTREYNWDDLVARRTDLLGLVSVEEWARSLRRGDGEDRAGLTPSGGGRGY